jgi:undecaprenyl-diphosphatase
VERFDEILLRSLYAGGSGSFWVWLFAILSLLGSGWVLLGLLPVFLMPRLRALRERAAFLFVTVLTAAAIVSATKAITGRVRPCQALAWAHTAGIHLPVDPSFPSGHATGSFAVAAFVLMLNRAAGLWLLVLAFFIALSRVALGVHYPTDVAAGAALGTVLGAASGLLLKRREADAA